jgi:Transcriptional regulator SbtR-like, C-terminal domain
MRPATPKIGRTHPRTCHLDHHSAPIADLIAGTFAQKIGDYADAIDTALAHPDPWQGFSDYIWRICAMQAEDRGFTNVLTMSFPTAKAFEDQRTRAYDGLVELIDRAKTAGGLRDDFCPEDIVVLLMANAGVINATGEGAPHAWRRFAAYMTQAFHADHAQPLPPALTPKAMYRALVRLHNAAS